MPTFSQYPSKQEVTKLNRNSIANYQGNRVNIPNYIRKNVQISTGVVHIGVGGFHRSHMARYHDQLFEEYGLRDWGICGVNILERDEKFQNALQQQNGLYTLLEQDVNQESLRVVGSITESIYGYKHPKLVIDKIIDPQTRIVSLTITEKGYQLNPRDQNTSNPQNAIEILVASLMQRVKNKMPGLTLLSCDNIQNNGDVLKSLILEFAEESYGIILSNWIDSECSFPNSMVDRITPTASQKTQNYIKDKYYIDDLCPVVCEPFRQWVIEDDFCRGQRPAWEKVGVELVSIGEVAAYETMKLRLLNASHSAITYLGALSGLKYIHDLVSQPLHSSFLKNFMDLDATPTLDSVPRVNLDKYKSDIIHRFANTKIQDSIARVCSDGSAKIKNFVLPIAKEQLTKNQPPNRIGLVVASWIKYLQGTDENGQKIVIEDVLYSKLAKAAKRFNEDPHQFLKIDEVFDKELSNNPIFIESVTTAWQHLNHFQNEATIQMYLNTQ